MRYSRVTTPAPPINLPAWVANTDIDGHTISFIGQTSLAVYAGRTASDGRVFAVGKRMGIPNDTNPYRLYAFSRNTGEVVWQSPVANPSASSFSSPTIDEVNGVVVFCSARMIQAYSISLGEPVWSTQLDLPVVNASPLITCDQGPRDRLFITDYEYSYGEGKVYCINVDPFDPLENPHQPGDLIWSAIIGPTTGNSVSYLPRAFGGKDLIFVASSRRLTTTETGRIYAFAIHPHSAEPEPIWMYTNTRPYGYFGGVCVVPPEPTGAAGEPPYIYAGSYSFQPSTDGSNLVKLNAYTGQEIWSVASNNTSSMPIPLPNGLIALSGGISGYGGSAGLQMFIDEGQSARLLWATDTFFLNAGSWTNQPVAALFGGLGLIAVGSQSANPSNPQTASNDLYLFDTSLFPNQPGFLVRHYQGVGGSPAIVGGSLYSMGTIGLAAFGTTPARLDVDQNNHVNIDDLYAWEMGAGNRDVNGDGVANTVDRSDLRTLLRGGELSTMKGPS